MQALVEELKDRAEKIKLGEQFSGTCIETT